MISSYIVLHYNPDTNIIVKTWHRYGKINKHNSPGMIWTNGIITVYYGQEIYRNAKKFDNR
jgi:hypothetical protein